MARSLLFALATLPFLVLGCASAKKQYERGMQYEVQGRYAEAAHYYARSIRRDPDLNRMVRGRLRESGRQAIEQYVYQAGEHERAGRWPDAADRYLDADGIVALGRSVQVEIPTPRRYDEQRRNTFDSAIEMLIDDAERAVDRADFEGALRRYARAARYEPEPRQADALREGTAYARVNHAQALLNMGRYRRAYDVAESGLASANGYHEAFRAVMYEALEAGTVRLAPLPVQRTGERLDDMPRGFADHLTIILEDEYWAYPPLFLESAHPRDVGFAMRRYLRRGQLVGNPRLVSEVGRELAADFAVASGVERFSVARGQVRRTERTVRHRRGRGSATYTEIRTPTTYRGSVRFEVVDVRSGRVVCGDRLDRVAEGDVLRGEYDGDIRELNLTRQQQALFTPAGAEEQERQLQDRLAAELAEAVAARAFACVVARVP